VNYVLPLLYSQHLKKNFFVELNIVFRHQVKMFFHPVYVKIGIFQIHCSFVNVGLAKASGVFFYIKEHRFYPKGSDLRRHLAIAVFCYSLKKGSLLV